MIADRGRSLLDRIVTDLIASCDWLNWTSDVLNGQVGRTFDEHPRLTVVYCESRKTSCPPSDAICFPATDLLPGFNTSLWGWKCMDGLRQLLRCGVRHFRARIQRHCRRTTDRTECGSTIKLHCRKVMLVFISSANTVEGRSGSDYMNLKFKIKHQYGLPITRNICNDVFLRLLNYLYKKN